MKELVRRFGLRGNLNRRALRTDIEKKLGVYRNLLDVQSQPDRVPARPVDYGRLQITWIIPDFSPGAGGHMTIFRIARLLEEFGHEIRFLIHNPVRHRSGASARHTINRHFQPFQGHVAILDHDLPELEGDALIATNWSTCYPANAMGGFFRKFYFVQDYEAMFYPAGSDALLTDVTYRFDFDCLCAGEWLRRIMMEKFGRWAASFPLAVDHAVYSIDEDFERKADLIAVYARSGTPRRAVELAILGLEALHRRGVEFEVGFFGGRKGSFEVPFPYRNYGTVKNESLANIYRQASIGLVFSATNHSLVNQEMMACGLPVVDLDIDTVRSIFAEGVLEFAAPTPAGIADALQILLENPARRDELRRKALQRIGRVSWPESARVVETAIKERVTKAVEASQISK
ncbi:glycosyltransferase family 4 protein [Roseibium polysiphoniae]|uniref:Glycosyltransferase family 4 protein n=1 Tax=Roseibium polysiphoniae TaxID=2571221 RepID=A0ABR9C9Q4_9HYPH|nr:glycosyltransferase family 4 protein [Roseibium polysiphoniae]MBD8876648.1 glycosyltransferase family 4 protein [Roseibium polysiphoniae]